jgi:uncharacterized protein (TIGR02391 family)
MSGLNTEWALQQLDTFLSQTVMRYPDPVPGVVDMTGHRVTAAKHEDILRQAQVVEQILDRVLPDWKSIKDGKSNRWENHREAALRAKEVLVRQEEVRKNLGEDAPEISAANLHPWAWSGAKSLWQSGHYRSAVDDAAKKVNAETQNKVGRRDVSETDLFKQAFSLDAPQAGKARLRRMKDDGSDSYRSMQRGAMALAEGIYAGIRNPFNHEDPQDIDEQVALEYLAALSVLARWVDESVVEAVG